MSRQFSVDQLFEAIDVGEFEIVRRIIESEPELVSERAAMGDQALHVACWQKRLEVVRLLLERGADAKSRGSNEATPLHYAAHQGDPSAAEEIGRALLDAGADPNAEDFIGRTPLDYAAVEAYAPLEPLIKLLLARGARMTVTTALMRMGPPAFERVLEEQRARTSDGALEVLEAVAMSHEKTGHVEVIRREMARRRQGC